MKTHWQGHAPPIPKGVPMPRTTPYYEKLIKMDEELIMEQREEIQRLKMTINDLRQKRRVYNGSIKINTG